MIRVTKQYKDKPRLLKFTYLFKNAITVNEVLKFLQKTEIVTRNWLQNQGRTEKGGADKGIKEREK
jgi:hypothetical protein